MEKKECLTIRQLAVSGQDLIAAGMQPGKQIGEMLNELLERVLEDSRAEYEGTIIKNCDRKDF